MKFEVVYRHLEHHEKLERHAHEKIERIGKYELKPSHIKFVLSARQHKCIAEVYIKGPDLFFNAKAEGEDHYAAMDAALDKLERQLARRKGKLQYHKKQHLSHEGTLSRMNARLEHGFDMAKRARKGSRAA